MHFFKNRIFIGNDVVDLTDKYAQRKGLDKRFILRVCSKDEAQNISNSKDTTLSLWKIWTAKETAIKIFQKNNPWTFVPLKEVVVDCNNLDNSLSGIVAIQNQRYFIVWEQTHEYLHCVGSNIAPNELGVSFWWKICKLDSFPSLDHLLKRFSDRERTSIFSKESAAVRVIAQDYFRTRLTEDFEIVREIENHCFAPPQIYKGGHSEIYSPNVDISFSHNSSFVASACLLDWNWLELSNERN